MGTERLTETATQVADFHRTRRMFAIIGDRVLIAPDGVSLSHAEWFAGIGHTQDIDTAVRGFWDQDGVYVYRGPKFFGGAHEAMVLIKHLTEIPAPEHLTVFLGMVPGPPGRRWLPVARLDTVGNLLGKRTRR